MIPLSSLMWLLLPSAQSCHLPKFPAVTRQSRLSPQPCAPERPTFGSLMSDCLPTACLQGIPKEKIPSVRVSGDIVLGTFGAACC